MQSKLQQIFRLNVLRLKLLQASYWQMKPGACVSLHFSHVQRAIMQYKLNYNQQISG